MADRKQGSLLAKKYGANITKDLFEVKAERMSFSSLAKKYDFSPSYARKIYLKFFPDEKEKRVLKGDAPSTENINTQEKRVTHPDFKKLLAEQEERIKKEIYFELEKVEQKILKNNRSNFTQSEIDKRFDEFYESVDQKINDNLRDIWKAIEQIKRKIDDEY